VEANQSALREMMIPAGHTYEGLKQLDQVIEDVERTPAAPQQMPGVPEAQVDSEAMSEPKGATTELAGETPAPRSNGLRPKLRGSQNR
jgi:hypothetical protein